MVFTQSLKKAADRLTRPRTSCTAPSLALFGVWRLLGSSMLATKDMEVSEYIFVYWFLNGMAKK